MVARGLGPFARKRCEVAAVARDEHAPLGGGEFEHERVVEPFERRVDGECEDVVSCRGGGEVGVQQQPHRGNREPSSRTGPAALGARQIKAPRRCGWEDSNLHLITQTRT